MRNSSERPLLSVIVPCYNMSQYVRCALDSLIANDYPAKQVILVDDGSTDETLSILYEYATEYSYFEVITKVNGGVSSARNVGLEHALGEYVMFMDPDDMVSDDYMNVIVKAISDGYDIIHFAFKDSEEVAHYSMSLQFSTRKEVLDCLLPSILGYGEDNVNNWLRGNRLKGTINGQVWAYAFRKSIIDAYHIRFAPHIIAGEDQMFVCSFLLYANSFKSIPDALYKYRIRDDGAFMINIRAVDINKTLQTKIDLLEERQRISCMWSMITERNRDDARALYAGSSVLSCFQLAALLSGRGLKGYRSFITYAHLPEVYKCIDKIVADKRGGIKKYLPAVLLKKKQLLLLFSLFAIARILHIKIQY